MGRRGEGEEERDRARARKETEEETEGYGRGERREGISSLGNRKRRCTLPVNPRYDSQRRLLAVPTNYVGRMKANRGS